MGITTSDYLRMLARQQKREAFEPSQTQAVEDESELHSDILAECRRRGWLAFHGSMAHKARRTLGEPDFTILCEWPRVLFVEAKTREGKPSPKQLEIHAWAAKLGHKIHVVRSMAEFMEVADGPH